MSVLFHIQKLPEVIRLESRANFRMFGFMAIKKENFETEYKKVEVD